MKIYWLLVFLIFIIWYRVSLPYAEPSWWSIFSSSRSTHTPMMEQVSLIKAIFIALIFFALASPVRQIIQKRK
ncbi:hypothetical protein F7984_02460 [Pradoshia sp. D12]|nr:hypothetical protein A8L44_13420 [Bacillus sp. FJAT-27986]QFK70199.1 hypothetical protein F7984_02460 [Pradoshia sp. D12]TPF70978.1 hypothetical protein FHY44_14635 [Bacillus sp. D12]